MMEESNEYLLNELIGKYESTLKCRSHSHGQMEGHLNSTQGITCPGTSADHQHPANTKPFVKLGTATPMFIIYISPFPTYRSRVTAWSQSFPCLGAQTISKRKAANCREARNWSGGAWERARKRLLSMQSSGPSFGPTSETKPREGC